MLEELIHSTHSTWESNLSQLLWRPSVNSYEDPVVESSTRHFQRFGTPVHVSPAEPDVAGVTGDDFSVFTFLQVKFSVEECRVEAYPGRSSTPARPRDHSPLDQAFVFSQLYGQDGEVGWALQVLADEEFTVSVHLHGLYPSALMRRISVDARQPVIRG